MKREPFTAIAELVFELRGEGSTGEDIEDALAMNLGSLMVARGQTSLRAAGLASACFELAQAQRQQLSGPGDDPSVPRVIQ